MGGTGMKELQRKENFRMVIEVRPQEGPLLTPDPDVKRLPIETTATTGASSSTIMNAFDLLDLLEKQPNDVLEMVKSNIRTTYMNESHRREQAKHFR
jgi:hypothetical protein